MFMIPGESLVPWVLFLKNLMQETLDTIVGEYQSEANRNRMILHSLYYLWHN